MIFGAVPLAEAKGHLLGHNVFDTDGRRRLRKGKPLSANDIELLAELGHQSVWVAQMEDGDISEDDSADRIARALLSAESTAENYLHKRGPRTGRVNVESETLGVLFVDVAQVDAINRFPGVTFATMSPYAVVDVGTTVATVKILPYAIPKDTIEEAERALPTNINAVRMQPLTAKRAALILTSYRASPSAHGTEIPKALSIFEPSLSRRLRSLGSTLERVQFISCGGDAAAADPRRTLAPLVDSIRQAVTQFDLVLIAGETAIQDRNDIIPSAIEWAGGEVTAYGAPVDPGNLVLVAKAGASGTPILGVPGCARSPKRNIVDLVLPRLLVGDAVTSADLDALGVGGLLDDVPERPLPRHKI